MSLTIPVAAARLRREVSTAETAFDAALLANCAIQATIISSRRELNVPVHAGPEALIRLQRAQAQLVAAQNDLFRAHDELAQLGANMITEDEYTPPSGLVTEEPKLRDAA